MAKRPTPKAKPERPPCSKCNGKGMYGEGWDKGYRVPILVGKSDNPMPCSVCGYVPPSKVDGSRPK